VPHVLPSSSLLPFFCLPSFGLRWGCIMRLPDIPHIVWERRGGARGQRGKAGCRIFYSVAFCLLASGLGLLRLGAEGDHAGRLGAAYGYGALIYKYCILHFACCLPLSWGCCGYVRVRESAAGGECDEKAPSQPTSEGQSAANKAPTNQGLAQSAEASLQLGKSS